MKKLFLALLFAGCYFIACFANIPSLSSRFDKITQAEGLSNNQIQCIFQEKSGWMWFGTSQGLNRYNGYQFSIFRSDIDKQGTLRGELVRCIYEDNQNRIWIGTEKGGLNLFNREKEDFTHFLFADNAIDTVFSVESIISDNTGQLWLATNKGVAFLDENQQLQLLDIFHNQFKQKIAASEILFDKKNNLWIGTYNGLFYYDFQTKTSHYIPFPETKNPDDEIRCLFIDSDNILWIGTYNSGPYYLNLNSKIIRKLNPWVNFSRSETVRVITEDQQGTLWFGTRGGLVAFDKNTEKHTVFLRDDDESLGGLSLNSVLSLCVDSKGDLWVGTRGGINYRDNDKQAFLHIKASKNDNRFLNDSEVYSFMFHNNNLLIGTESGGINICNMDNLRFRYVERQQGLSSNCVKAFLKHENEILVGTFQGGLNILDATTYRVKEVLQHRSNNPKSLSDDRVWCIFKDYKKKIWIGTQRGVDIYDPNSKSFEYQEKFFPQKACLWIYEDETGDLWMGGENEFLIYNPETEKIIRYPEVTRSILPTSDKKFWLGTRGHGLALYDKEHGPLKYLTQANGLCNNVVQCILRDVTGYIWVSTTNGLSRFDEQNNEFVNFDFQDGLQDNQFNYTAAIIARDNNFIFGGINGINIFNPLNIRRNFFVPPVVFTELKVFNKKVSIGNEINKSINESPDIYLSYKQNVFSLEFAALSYAGSKKNQYEYMMEGFDKNWIYSGTNNTATYTNLDPGTYTFKVKGSNSNGIWNDKAASIKIIIAPPFWKTLWFRLLIVLIIGVILYQIAIFYLKRIRLNDELVFEKTKARKLHEIETMKLRFFTNISHEIRTPLTLILGPLNQVIEEGEVDEESRKKLGLIKRNADQLMKLISQILDFRKLEAGKYKITYGKADLVLFIGSIVESFQTMATEKQIEMSFSTGEDTCFTWFDSDKIQKILNNLLSNAVKFTDTNGAINISFELINKLDTETGNTNFYQILVSDSGKGIPAKNIGRIFERFEQAPNTKNANGSGIGLSITREFVKLMKGEISVESQEGSGSKFTVELPILNDEDINTMDVGMDSKTVVDESLPINALTEGIKNIILVVDDNADIREYIASNFEPEAQVIQAANGKEGYEMALKYIPDIVISDLLMPEMNGDAFCKKMKKDERASHIPFILLTAVTSKDVEKDTLRAGADDYITKPFDIHILKLKVDNLLSLRNTLREKYKNEFILNPTAVKLVSPDEKFLKKAVDIVEKYMDDAELDIEKFSSEVGVSRMQLYRKLEALTNMTVKEFIRDIRLKRAAQLLEQNKANVSEIIYQVGFKDLAYFRKCFREQYGMSPSDYAAKFKQ